MIACTHCPRLVEWREGVGREKRAAFRDWDYWSKPVPGFGDPKGSILILGLAPGAHGSNRTGRPFTGDASGDFLYPALYRAGLANQAHSTHRGDGLKLSRVYITASVRCAPPGNKPGPQELRRCAQWTKEELEHLPNIRVVLALGRIAHHAVLDYLGLRKATYPFAHAAQYKLPNGWTLLDSYHVSRQNTNTGRLTVEMFDSVLLSARQRVDQETRRGWDQETM
jgi:uracil-DNA glycosylase family 4